MPTESTTQEQRRTIWMSGALDASGELLRHAGRPDLGVLVQPGTLQYLDRVEAFSAWGFDNGCFAEYIGGRFDVGAWWAAVEALPAGARFVVAPDVVGDCAATWERSAPWLSRIRDAGHVPALVAQDGIESTRIDWDAFGCLFIGGTDAWKLERPRGPLSSTVYRLIAEANDRGKWTHVGRVNSAVRYVSCCDAGADSADGTFLVRAGMRQGIPRVLSWFSAWQSQLAQPSLELA